MIHRVDVQTWTILPPPPDLAETVECFYVTEPSATGVLETMPDGRADVVLVCSASAPRFELYGPATRPRSIEVETGVRYCGVRIRPGLAGSFLRDDAWRFADKRVAMPVLRGISAADSAESADPARPLADIVRDGLNRPAQSSRWARRAVAAVIARAGAIRVEELAGEVGMSRRALERIFAAEIGDSPKHFVRITRLQALGRLLRDSATIHWADLAAALGYSDQSHLVRDVRELTGYRPTHLRRRIREMPPDWV